MFGVSSVIIYAIIAAALFASGAWSGWRVESWHRDSVEQKSERIAELQVQREQDKAAAASVALEQAKQDAQTRTQVITKTVDRIVLRPQYRDICLDADGLQSANNALQGSAGAPGQLSPALPAVKPAGGRIGGSGLKKAGGG